jgi:Outer membrane protein beta-barrel domain
MKANLRTLAIATCLALGTCAQAEGVFFRPELSFDFASLNGSDANGFKIKDAVGYGIAVGNRFGTQDESEFGVSVDAARFSLSPNVVGGAGSGNLKIIPLLANYRYYFGAKVDAVRCYLAPSIGWTTVKTNYTAFSGGTITSNGATGGNFTGCIGVGALVKLEKAADLDFGYRYIGGLKVRTTNIKATVGTLYAGLNIRF